MKILKYHPHGAVLFVTFSLEEGLMLLANPLCRTLLQSCLAAAQDLYPVRISGFMINANHVHVLLVVDNPDDVSGFIRHFKTESAHMLNRVLGRRKRTIWCEGYDSPIVLTPTRALIALSYLYSNPAKDNLEESIDKYPGLSSWEMIVNNQAKMRWKRIRRPAVSKIKTHNLKAYTREAERLLNDSKEEYTFTLSPNAWLEAFGITDSTEQEAVNKKLIARIRTLEERAANVRKREGKKVMGREKLVRQPISTSYQSKRSGKRMACLSDDVQLRIDFIGYLKDLYAKARTVLERWKSGDYSFPYPLGLYPPSMPKLAEPISIW